VSTESAVFGRVGVEQELAGEPHGQRIEPADGVVPSRARDDDGAVHEAWIDDVGEVSASAAVFDRCHRGEGPQRDRALHQQERAHRAFGRDRPPAGPAHSAGHDDGPEAVPHQMDAYRGCCGGQDRAHQVCCAALAELACLILAVPERQLSQRGQDRFAQLAEPALAQESIVRNRHHRFREGGIRIPPRPQQGVVTGLGVGGACDHAVGICDVGWKRIGGRGILIRGDRCRVRQDRRESRTNLRGVAQEHGVLVDGVLH
jgi:hypothetical protein